LFAALLSNNSKYPRTTKINEKGIIKARGSQLSLLA
jgi:hypothetical protein